jgi:hypothetical protein
MQSIGENVSAEEVRTRSGAVSAAPVLSGPEQAEEVVRQASGDRKGIGYDDFVKLTMLTN